MVSVIISFLIFISSFSILSQSDVSLDCSAISWSIVLLEFSSSFVWKGVQWRIDLRYIKTDILDRFFIVCGTFTWNLHRLQLHQIVRYQFYVHYSPWNSFKWFSLIWYHLSTLYWNILLEDLKSLFLCQLKCRFHFSSVMELPLKLAFKLVSKKRSGLYCTSIWKPV